MKMQNTVLHINMGFSSMMLHCMSSLQSYFNYQTQKQMQQLTSRSYFNTSNSSSQKHEQSSSVLQNFVLNVAHNKKFETLMTVKPTLLKGKGHPITGHQGPRGGVQV
jgi:hypothetical protein